MYAQSMCKFISGMWSSKDIAIAKTLSYLGQNLLYSLLHCTMSIPHTAPLCWLNYFAFYLFILV